MTETVGYAALQIIPSAKGFKRALEQETGTATRSAGLRGGSSFRDGFLSKMRGIAGPLTTVLGAGAVFAFTKQSIDAASNLSEAMNKSNVIFGNSSKAISSWSQDSSKNILLTQQEAIDAASQFALFGKAAGLTGNDLAGFSTDLTGLAQDFSSFFNTDNDTAITAIGAALRGESEPIRQFGVLLNDDLVKAEALRMGLLKSSKDEAKIAVAKARLMKAQENLNKVHKKSNATAGDVAKATASVTAAQSALSKAVTGTIGTLTPQQRVLAAQSLIMQQTSDAQGDAARTAGGYANQQRILAKNIDAAKISLGEGLLPAVTTLVKELNGPAGDSLKTMMKNIGPKLGAAVGKGIEHLTRFVTWLSDNGDTVRKFAAAIIAFKTGLAVGAAVSSFITIVGGLIKVFKAVRSAALAATVAEAFATGGASVIAGSAGALAAVAAFKISDNMLNDYFASTPDTSLTTPQAWKAPRPGQASTTSGMPSRISNNTVNVYNPTPEPASKSVRKAVQRQLVLGSSLD